MITDLKTIIHAWEQGYSFLWEDEDRRIAYPFEVADVAGLHTHKTGTGDGVFFRLKDGRVFSSYGDWCQDTDPASYDTVPN